MESLKNENRAVTLRDHHNHECLRSREVQYKVVNAVRDDSQKIITDDMKNVVHKEIVNEVGGSSPRRRGC